MMQMFNHKIATTQDPNRPRRGMSAFMLFSNEFRAQVRLEMPDLSFGDVARELTRRWSDLPFDRKEVWAASSCLVAYGPYDIMHEGTLRLANDVSLKDLPRW